MRPAGPPAAPRSGPSSDTLAFVPIAPETPGSPMSACPHAAHKGAERRYRRPGPTVPRARVQIVEPDRQVIGICVSCVVLYLEVTDGAVGVEKDGGFGAVFHVLEIEQRSVKSILHRCHLSALKTEKTTSPKVRWMSMPITRRIRASCPSGCRNGSGGRHDNYGFARSARTGASRRGGQLLTRARSSSSASACPHLRAPGASVPDGRTIRRGQQIRSWTSAPGI